MELHLKTFLGKKPARLVGVTQRTEDEDHVIRSVNHYLINDGKTISVPELNIIKAGQLRLVDPIVYVDKTTAYVPLRVQSNMAFFTGKEAKKVAIYSPKDVFFVKGLGSRPNLEHLFKTVKKLLASDYPGSVDNYHGRYAVCLSNARMQFVYTLLQLAVMGDGKVIDYSWIAPLQELFELKEDEERKAKQPPVTEEPEPTPHDQLPPSFLQAVAKAKAQKARSTATSTTSFISPARFNIAAAEILTEMTKDEKLW